MLSLEECNLKRKDPDTFEWLFPVHGDWHFVKSVRSSEKVCYGDGGFHDIAAKYGMKEVSKWKDIHRILITLLEAGMVSVGSRAYLISASV